MTQDLQWDFFDYIPVVLQDAKSKAAFARFNGSAPIPVWSGNQTRHRLNRGGNRQVNAALHRIAITQKRLQGPGRDYVERRMQLGKTKTEAIRLLRRRISDQGHPRRSAPVFCYLVDRPYVAVRAAACGRFRGA